MGKSLYVLLVLVDGWARCNYTFSNSTFASNFEGLYVITNVIVNAQDYSQSCRWIFVTFKFLGGQALALPSAKANVSQLDFWGDMLSKTGILFLYCLFFSALEMSYDNALYKSILH